MPPGSAPQNLGLKEEGKAHASRGLAGPILTRVDFEIQVGAMEKAVGQVSAVRKDLINRRKKGARSGASDYQRSS